MDTLILEDSKEIIENLAEQNNRFSGRTILLTGSAGFLGTQFIHYFAMLNDSGLLSKPLHVLAMDNFSRGEPDWVASCRKRDDISIIHADITDRLEIDDPVDFIIHAASIASPIYYRQHPIETMDANVLGLRQLLDFALQNVPESMLFFSSSEIYGDPEMENIPTPESYLGRVSCTGPRACYDESKRFGETLCVEFNRIHKTPVKIVRPFNNYGPALKISDKRVLPDFFSDILAGKDIVMYSDGSPTRTFCYISDAMTGYLLALLSDADGESFNIGTDKPEVSMAELADMVVGLSAKPLRVVYQKAQESTYLQDNPNRRCPDINKAKRVLGYTPKVSLEEGLRRTNQWYLANTAAPEG